MTGDIVNLRLARKRKAREAAASEADKARLAHGMPKSVRTLDHAVAEIEIRRLEGHRLTSSGPKARDAED